MANLGVSWSCDLSSLLGLPRPSLMTRRSTVTVAPLRMAINPLLGASFKVTESSAVADPLGFWNSAHVRAQCPQTSRVQNLTTPLHLTRLNQPQLPASRPPLAPLPGS